MDFLDLFFRFAAIMKKVNNELSLSIFRFAAIGGNHEEGDPPRGKCGLSPPCLALGSSPDLPGLAGWGCPPR